MKVLQILYSGLGGHGGVAFALHKAAVKVRSWKDSMLFVGIEPVVPQYEQICARDAMECSSVQTRAGRPWASWLPVYRSLKKTQPDAILLHSVKLILPCWLYSRRRGVPLVAVEHQQNVLKAPSEWMVSWLLMLLADQVVVLTDEYRRDLEKGLSRWFNREKVSVIANGTDVQFFSPEAGIAGHDHDTMLLGMAARFSSAKGQALLVHALEALCESDQQGKWRLTLAGEGDTLEQVRQLVEDKGMQDVVEFAGYLAEEELAAWFRRLDVYVHASDGETLSTSLLQAMSTGLPIVASDAPGIRNLIGGAEPVGLLADNDDPVAFARILRELGDDESLRKRLAQSARRRAVEKYSHETMYRNYSRILEACQKSSI
jgi:glycosyltransferase involved in cell wall biosynthesis